MKKDIPVYKVSDVYMAVVPQEGDFWEVYLINAKPLPLLNVLLSSRGYGQLAGEHRKTSQMRYFFERIEAQTAILVELLPSSILSLANEFWLSFQIEPRGFLYDRKYVFVPGSLSRNYLSSLPLLDTQGILIG